MQARYLKLARLSGFVRAACVTAVMGSLVGVASAQEPEAPDGVQGLAEGDSSTLLTLKLKDRDLRDVVASIRRKTGSNIIMDPGIDETVTIELKDLPWRKALALVVEQAGCVVTSVGSGVLKIEKPPRVHFAFEDTDIQKVIDTIAKISGANIVVAPEVQGNITLRLKNIPWRDALNAAVKTLGFVVVEEDYGILRVVPASNIEQDLITRTFQLRYVRPQSAYVPFLKSEYVTSPTPNQGGASADGRPPFRLLEALQATVSDVGTMQYLDEANALIVKDTRPIVDQITEIIEQVDIEPAQVFLDVRFVTTSNRDVLDIGVSPGGNGWSASLSLGQIPTRLPFDLGAGGFDDSIIASDQGVGPFADPSLNAGGVNIPDVVFGALNFQEVSATLRLLKRDESSEILQAPKIVALDNQTATIFVGEAVRYAQGRVEQGQAGGLLLALEEGDDSPVNVGFQLLTIPHIIPGTDKVILEVIPQRTSLSGTGASALAPAGFDVFTVGTGTSAGQGSIALPRVASSTIATKVLLQSGQTAVLGGLVSRTQVETEIKIPLLGDIPVLGWLFKNKVTDDSQSTLVVFITPNIIRSSEDTRDRVLDTIKRKFDFRKEIMAQRDEIFGTK